MSLKIQRFVCNPFQENCYVVSDTTGEGVVIDCGAYFPEERQAVVRYITDNNILVKHLIATHGHVDHNFGNDTLFSQLGLKVEVCGDDQPLMEALDLQCRQFLGVPLGYDMPPVGSYFSPIDYAPSFGSHSLIAVPTPGHTPGGVVLWCEEEEVAFTGDTLFRMSVGRTDFEGGSHSLLLQSLHSLAQRLPSPTTILPGHGPKTTMGFEIEHNHYF